MDRHAAQERLAMTGATETVNVKRSCPSKATIHVPVDAGTHGTIIDHRRERRPRARVTVSGVSHRPVGRRCSVSISLTRSATKFSTGCDRHSSTSAVCWCFAIKSSPQDSTSSSAAGLASGRKAPFINRGFTPLRRTARGRGAGQMERRDRRDRDGDRTDRQQKVRNGHVTDAAELSDRSRCGSLVP